MAIYPNLLFQSVFKYNLSKEISVFFQKGCLIPQRVVLAIFIFFGLLIAFAQRMVLYVAITRMVIGPKNPTDANITRYQANLSCLAEETGTERGEFDWSETRQASVLSSFYWGYVGTHILAGLLADECSGKWTLISALIISSSFTLLIPTFSEHGQADAIIVARVMMGLGQGAIFPALHVLMCNWVPRSERFFLGSLVKGGGMIGYVVGSLITASLINYFESWEEPFYCFGLLGWFWCSLFVCFCYDDPFDHPFVTEKEEEFLKTELALSPIKDRDDINPTPWKSIFRSTRVWSLILGTVGHDFGYYIIVMYLPKYYADVFDDTLEDIGFFTAIPMLVLWISTVIFSFIAGFAQAKKILKRTTVRRGFSIFAAIFSSLLLVAAIYAECEQNTAVTYFCLGLAATGAWYPGMKANVLDLTPTYERPLSALVNGIGSVVGIVVPYVISNLTPNVSIKEWKTVAWAACFITIGLNIPFVFFGSGRVQVWNEPPSIFKMMTQRR